MQVQVLLPAPKLIGHQTVSVFALREQMRITCLQRLAFCEANGDFSRQDKLAAERSEAVSHVTLTNKKEEHLLCIFSGENTNTTKKISLVVFFLSVETCQSLPCVKGGGSRKRDGGIVRKQNLF